MEWLVVVLVLAAAAVAIAVAVRRGRERQRAAAPQGPRDPFADTQTSGSEDAVRRLRVGDIVSVNARDFAVRGALHFDEHGYRWDEFLLDDVKRKRWLSVEDDEGTLEVSMWESVPVVDVQGEPGASAVVLAGVSYRREEQGSASFTAEGSTGTAPSGTVDYVDYVASDRRQLGFERFGSSWEVATGTPMLPGELTIWPHGT